MVQVEAALLHAWGRVDGTSYEPAARVLDSVAADPRALDHDALVAGVARDGVVVVALVALLRDALAGAGVPDDRLHAGATSQDVLDTALVLVARTTATQVRENLVATGSVLADLADTERAVPRVGHTLGRQAAPTTVGAQAAGWLDGITSAIEVVDALRFPVQLGGAVGTGEQADRTAGRAGAVTALRAAVATALDLDDPGRSWHAERTPVLAIATAAATVVAALGRIGRDLVAGSREGVDELRLAGGGASSAMPHKRNPVGPVRHVRRSRAGARPALDDRARGGVGGRTPRGRVARRVVGAARPAAPRRRFGRRRRPHRRRPDGGPRRRGAEPARLAGRDRRTTSPWPPAASWWTPRSRASGDRSSR